MLGSLPRSLEVNGTQYEIDADFRTVLNIFLAFSDDELTDQEKAYICLHNLYADFDSIPSKDVEAAYKSAIDFISYGSHAEDEHGKRKLIDWVQDESLIFPAVNKAAGMEVRETPFMHWWTFLGHFQSIDNESLLGTVLSIRQKKSKGKKLEKWEREFERGNRSICALPENKNRRTPEDDLQAMIQQMIEEGAIEHE